MPDMQFLPDSVAGCADATQPFKCSRTEGGLDAVWDVIRISAASQQAKRGSTGPKG